MFLITAALAASLAFQQPDAPRQVSNPAPPHVNVILFSDFQCPFCARFAGPFRELQKKGVEGVEVDLVFEQFPLSIHPAARLEHQAALAAKAQGKFWEMHDVLFANRSHVTRDDLLGYADRLGLDRLRFERDMDSDAIKTAIASDIADGVSRGVNATPTVIVGGKSYAGVRSYDELARIIRGEPGQTVRTHIDDKLMSRGPAVAAARVEMFLDLQSPITAPAVALVSRVLEQYPNVRLQFRSFPLAFHPQASLAHEAAIAAARSGHFWDFVAYVLEHQSAISEENLVAEAARLGLDRGEFTASLREHRFAGNVEADLAAGQARGVRGSPAIVINGRRIDGLPTERVLTDALDAALAAEAQPK
jgi:protein-disulfide isomerase